MLCKVFGVE